MIQTLTKLRIFLFFSVAAIFEDPLTNLGDAPQLNRGQLVIALGCKRPVARSQLQESKSGPFFFRSLATCLRPAVYGTALPLSAGWLVDQV